MELQRALGDYVAQSRVARAEKLINAAYRAGNMNEGRMRCPVFTGTEPSRASELLIRELLRMRHSRRLRCLAYGEAVGMLPSNIQRME